MLRPQQVSDLVGHQFAGHGVVEDLAVTVSLRQPQCGRGHRGSRRVRSGQVSEVRSGQHHYLHPAHLSHVGQSFGVARADVGEVGPPSEQNHDVVTALLRVTGLHHLVGVTHEDLQQVEQHDGAVKLLGQLVIVLLNHRVGLCSIIPTPTSPYRFGLH